MGRVSLEAFRELEAKKLVTIQKHPAYDLLIFNYTALCQFEAAWDEHTLMARGLITDLEGVIVARPFRKFFNLSEHQGTDCKLPPVDWGQSFTVHEKLDGSLGILYPTPDGHRVATRGSFTSPQSQKGTELWLERYAGKPLCPGYTYLFEILFPENRIVVDYGTREDLVLLDVVRVSDGFGSPWEEVEGEARRLGCPAAKRFTELETAERIQAHAATPAEHPTNAEGYVLRFDDGTRVKVKLDEYVRLHRLLTCLNARHIWENLAAGKSLEDLLNRVPDEFNAWVKQTAGEITARYAEMDQKARAVLVETKTRLGDAAPRKDYALEFAKHPDVTPLLWGLFDGKDIRHMIWKRIRPESTKAFRCDG